MAEKTIAMNWYATVFAITQRLIAETEEIVLCVDQERPYVQLAKKEGETINIFGNIFQTFDRTPERICQQLALLAKIHPGFTFATEFEEVTLTTTPGITSKQLLRRFYEDHQLVEDRLM